MTQDDLFTGSELKTAGCALVLDHNEAYKVVFDETAAFLIKLYGKVTSADVVRAIGMPPGQAQGTVV